MQVAPVQGYGAARERAPTVAKTHSRPYRGRCQSVETPDVKDLVPVADDHRPELRVARELTHGVRRQPGA